MMPPRHMPFPFPSSAAMRCIGRGAIKLKRWERREPKLLESACPLSLSLSLGDSVTGGEKPRCACWYLTLRSTYICIFFPFTAQALQLARCRLCVMLHLPTFPHLFFLLPVPHTHTHTSTHASHSLSSLVRRVAEGRCSAGLVCWLVGLRRSWGTSRRRASLASTTTLPSHLSRGTRQSR